MRARHLALSADEPDAEAAALLEASADRARRRGAAARAAELAAHAVRLTPGGDADAARRRTLAQVGHLAASGEVGRALEVADGLIAGLPPGAARAEALILRAQLEDDDLETGEALLRRALDDARDDALLRGRVLDMLGWLRAVFRGDVAAGVADLREAVEIADAVGDVDLQVRALAALGHLETLAGTPRPDLMQRAMELEARIEEPLLWAGPRALLAKHRLWAGDLPEARALFEALLDDAVRNGNERLRPYCLYDLALVDCAEGDLAAAEARLHLGLEAASDAEDAHVGSWLLYPLAHLDAWRGRAADARSRAEGILEWAARRGEGPGQARARGLLGLLSLSEGDAEAAAGELAEAAHRLAAMGVGHPAAIPVLPDAVEALAACGRAAEAGELLARLEAASRETGPWAAAAAARSRGMLLLSGAAPEDALGPLQHAAAQFEALGFRLDAARAVLGYGRALLRAGRRGQAADALADARARFAAMSASLWEARAIEDLERASPGRSAGELTPTERRVAALVAVGQRNRQIGQTLFMSVASVEAHLTRIYRKLGIGSRSELARLVAEGRVET